MRFSLASALTALALAAPAGAVELGLPIDCEPNKTCWIVHYPDHDPGPGSTDYTCGVRTYDDKKGVSFAVRNKAVMRSGVAVRAAAAGKVVGVRDGMRDIEVEKIGGIPALKGKDCGNGVGVDHGDGWFTQYCHMMKGSLTVKQGDMVQAGQTLGLVGLSGRTSYPHLAMSVRLKGAVVDPFTGPGTLGECGKVGRVLWSDAVAKDLPYVPTFIADAGFADGKADFAAALDGRLADESFPADAPALVMWMVAYGVMAGDAIRFRIQAPDGSTLLEESAPVKKNRDRKFLFMGRKRPGAAWPKGVYVGEVRIVREGDARTYDIARSVTLR